MEGNFELEKNEIKEKFKIFVLRSQFIIRKYFLSRIFFFLSFLFSTSSHIKRIMNVCIKSPHSQKGHKGLWTRIDSCVLSFNIMTYFLILRSWLTKDILDQGGQKIIFIEADRK